MYVFIKNLPQKSISSMFCRLCVSCQAFISFLFSCHLSTLWHEVLPTVCLLCERCTELFRRSSLANVQVVVMIINIMVKIIVKIIVNIIVNIIVKIIVKILIIIIGYGCWWWPSYNLHPLAQQAPARSIIFAVSSVCIEWWKPHE